ncbi:hypothetical protein EXIGLDRAFT_301418 [Exidia glandulosa HHB12029]|uniref:Uncharacterized protein n=1 Tax=Exidia glandulosa HHB12029 TaxID=1314781 RepID=A0A165D7R3_EXIGL|nr:hypothetical protein EXIGLDRAFT_301418 [Exidia glandulosa HHB12029]
MNPLFPASNAQDYANAYTGGFDPSESGGTSTRTTPTMGADFGGFDAGAAWASEGDAYFPRVAYDGATWPNGSFHAANHMRVPDAPLPPPSFDPEHPFADLYPATRDRAFDATYGNGSLDGGAMNFSIVPPQVGVGPPYALSHYPVPDSSVNNPFHAMYPGMQRPFVGDFNGGAMAAPNPSYPIYQSPPHPPAFNAVLERSHTGYPNFAPANHPYLPPSPPVDMSAQDTSTIHASQRVPYDDAGSLDVQGPLVPAAGIDVPPARGRKGKAKKPKAKAKANRARKQKGTCA